MKRLLVLFLLLVGLGAVAYFFKPADQKTKTSLSTTDRDFAFPEDQMRRITIQKVGEEMQTFTRRDGGIWYINDKYKVSQFIIPNITKTLSKISIQNIPSKSESELIHRDIAKVGIQIQIFDLEDKLARSFKIGLESIDETGTAFLMDGASQPYNMFLKGLSGDVRTRFVQGIDEWRDRELFQYKASDIAQIGVKYHKDQKSSFRLTVDNGKYDVKPLSKFIEPSSKPIDPAKVKAYLGAFTRIYGEDYDNDNIRRDSIQRLVPWATVAIENKAGEVNEIDFFPFRDLLLKHASTVEAEEAKLIERYFLNRNNQDFMVAQNKLVRPIFRPYDYFLKE